jgi:hypothetical protein
MPCSPKLYWFTFIVQTYAPDQTRCRNVNEEPMPSKLRPYAMPAAATTSTVLK